MRRLFLFCVFVSTLTGAMPARAADSASTPISRESTVAARKLYLAKCAHCHKLYNPANYSDAKWHEWMEKMSKKAKLNPEQKDMLSEYLETLRTGTNSPAGHRQ